MQLRPSRTCERPFLLVAIDEAIKRVNPQVHGRTLVEPVAFALGEMVEEGPLEGDTAISVELGPLLGAVELKPFRRRAGSKSALASHGQIALSYRGRRDATCPWFIA